jgi:hypothetical protein
MRRVWNEHRDAEGRYCRLSNCTVPTSKPHDARCAFDCPDSRLQFELTGNEQMLKMLLDEAADPHLPVGELGPLAKRIDEQMSVVIAEMMENAG